MRVFMFLLAVALLTGGTLVVRASAENVKDGATSPQVQQDSPQVQQENDVPEAARKKRKLYA